MKCIAIDDEPVALGIIRQFCQRSGDIELITFTDPVEGLQKVKDMHPDLVFLDIEMGGFNGIDVARQLPAGTFLIFTTAYAEFAVDGFDLDAVDFLHKPFSYNRFERAVEKVKRLQELQRLQAKPVFADEEITLKVEYKNVKIRLADIEYIEALHTGNTHFRQTGSVANQHEDSYGIVTRRTLHTDSQIIHCSLT